jgi:hypothetical protein
MRRNQIENFHSAPGGHFAYIAFAAAARATHIQELFLKKVIQHYVKKKFFYENTQTTVEISENVLSHPF